MRSCNEIRKAATAFSKRRWNYYNFSHRLVSVSSNSTLVALFAYDTQGRRAKKVADDGTHRYFYDGWLLIYEHIIRPDNTTNEIEYVWGKDISGTRDGAAGIGGLLYVAVSDSNSQRQLYVPFYDAYGNVLGYCDAQGNVVTQYTYDAFGKLIAKSSPLADTFAFRFSTKYFDAESGLYYYGYRFYKPEVMSWLTEDPIMEAGGLNLYAMCGNDPVSCFDALGKFKISYVTSCKTSFWEELLSHGKKTKDIEPKNENDLYIEYKVMNVNGAFHDNAFFVSDCHLEVRLEIWLHPSLQKSVKPLDAFIVSPHKVSVYDGYSYKIGGGRTIEGAVLAHERGHAKAFFLHQKSVFESKISALRSKSKLTAAEKKTVEKAYKDSRQEIVPQSIKYSNENMHKWFIANGFSFKDEGDEHVYQRK